MDLRRINDELTVSPQIDAADLARIARLGFRMVINNRPDDEVGTDQQHEAMRRAAEAAGLAYRFVPFTPGRLTSDMVEDFARAMIEADGPVLAWCRSGTRSATLWAISQAGLQPADDILGAARQAGYDLSQFAPLLSMNLRG